MGQEKFQQISTEEYINSHINRVQKWIGKFSSILFIRGVNHDKSKLCEPELSLWKKMDEEPRYPYGTLKYKEKLNRYKEVFQHHYMHNKHHPEHWSGYYSEMDLMDVIEMLCDWLGYKEDITLKEAETLVNQQCERYGFNDTFRHLLYNTLKNYFTVSPSEKSLNELFRQLKLDDPDELEEVNANDTRPGRLINIYV